MRGEDGTEKERREKSFKEFNITATDSKRHDEILSNIQIEYFPSQMIVEVQNSSEHDRCISLSARVARVTADITYVYRSVRSWGEHQCLTIKVWVDVSCICTGLCRICAISLAGRDL